MANIHGKQTFIAFEDSSSASRNLSGDGNSVTMSESINNPENTGFGDNNVQRTGSGLNDAKFSYEGWANDTATTANMAVLAALKGLPTMICYAPNGSLVGAASPVKYTACVIVDDTELRAPVEGLVVCRASFSLMSGSVTKSTSWATTM